MDPHRGLVHLFPVTLTTLTLPESSGEDDEKLQSLERTKPSLPYRILYPTIRGRD